MLWDVMGCYGGVETSIPDHLLLRTRIWRASNTNPKQLRRFAVNRLKDRDVASRYYDELESELQDVQVPPLKERRQIASHPEELRMLTN
jgi:hypothetical protein